MSLKREKSEGEKKQDERIKENLRGVNWDFTGMSYPEFEDLFEDRDPFEFL
jgi:hypothetical protein